MNNMNVQEKQSLHRLMWLANVQQFFQDRAATQLWEDYASWLKNRDAFQALYQAFPLKGLYDLDLADAALPVINGILISFHYGPYRLLPKLLVRMGYSVTLLASASILERETQYYRAELEDAGLPKDSLECIDANKASSLRGILTAIRNKRLVLVFLDADEGLQKEGDSMSEQKLAVPFGNHYFFWRTNIFKMAARFQIPLHCTYMQRGDSVMKWRIAPFLQIMETDSSAIEERMMRAFSALQMAFLQMMRQGWVFWENWAFIHEYNGRKAIDKKGITARGSWLAPFECDENKYLFDVKNRQFFKIEG